MTSKIGTVRSPMFRASVIALGLALAALSAGCSGLAMKGTPFWSGEYEKREGPAEDRVNFWPVLYYRAPALSIVWPMFELTDEHLALRPLFSVYGLDKDERVYNVLWPFIQFNYQEDTNRAFPFLWWGGQGTDSYFVVFPLYWHYGYPCTGSSGTDALFPLWLYERRGEYHWLFYALWPFIHVRHLFNEEGWCAWPLVGSFWDTNDYDRYALWPLARWWKDGPESGHRVLPLYSYWKGVNDWGILTPFFGTGNGGNIPWHAVIPLYFYVGCEPPGFLSGGGSSTFLTLLGGWSPLLGSQLWWFAPLLSAGASGYGKNVGYLLLGLAGWKRDSSSRAHWAIPFYHYAADKDSWRFLSIPWSSGAGPGDQSWQLLPPLFFHNRTPTAENLVTPLWSQGTFDGGAGRWRTLFPFFYWRQAADERILATLFFYWRQAADERILATLFFYWRQAADEKVLATLLGGMRWDDAGNHWLIYPLLSGGSHKKGEGNIWVLAPLIHVRWDKDSAAHHVLPFYYWDGARQTFISPLAAQWHDGDRKTILAVPLLSWLTTGGGRSDLWLAGPLAHLSWGEKPGPSHLFPLFYYNPDDHHFISLLYSQFKDSYQETRSCPLLLSFYRTRGKEKELVLLAWLFRHQWGEPRQGGPARSEGHLFPLYVFGSDRFFYTPLFGWNNDKDDGFIYPLTPFLGIRRGSHSGFWLWPVLSWDHNKTADTTHARFLWGTYESSSSKRSHGLFPLWSHKTRENTKTKEMTSNTSVLLFLYDRKHEVKPAKDDPKKMDDYLRTRVLWRLWHYERSNGDVSVDVFPAISYDSRTDGFRQFSLLHRLVRYQTDPAKGAKKLDLLFLPLMRRGSATETPRREEPTGTALD